MARSNGELVARAARMAGDAAGGWRRWPRRARGSGCAPCAAPMTLPLSGLRVLDLTRLLPGGYCTLLLADHGADVIKVEDTGAGDYALGAAVTRARRRLGLFLAEPRQAVDPAGPEVRGRAGGAPAARGGRPTCVIESFRPGVMDRLGVGFDVLREANPSLVYCAISGYGQDGPLRGAGGARPQLPRRGRACWR